MRVVLLTRHIGHYHNARFAAAHERIKELTVISMVGEAEVRQLAAIGTPIYEVRQLFRDISEYNAAIKQGKIFPVLTEALNSLAPDVVVLSGWSGPENISALWWARLRGRKTVLMSESQHSDASRSRYREFVKSLIVAQCDAAFVGGNSHSKYVVGLGMPSDRVFLGYDAVDNEYFAKHAHSSRLSARKLRSHFGLPERYVLASARFIPKKNLLSLIDAYASVQDQLPLVPDLVLLGDGPLRERIVERVRSTGLCHRIKFAGFRSYPELPIFYALSEGLVHVSTVEQWGLVVNEAMACGVPAVVSRTCGVTNILADQQSAILVEPDVRDIARGLLCLFQLSGDARQSMGQRAKEAIQPWGTARFAQGLVAAVECALQAPSRKPISPIQNSLFFILARKRITAVA